MIFKKFYKSLISIVVVGFLLVSCVKENKEMKVLLLDSSTNCQSIQLMQGQEILLTLASNPTTGYGWNIAKKPAFLEILQEATYQQDAHSEGMVGVGGKITWRFKVAGKGDDVLELFYSQPWVKNVAPAKEFNCTLLAH